MSKDPRPAVYVELYLAQQEAWGLKATTLRAYRMALENFLQIPTLPDDVRELGPEHAIAWVSRARAQKWTPGGIRTRQTAIWTWFRWLYRSRFHDTDISQLVKRVPVPTRNRRTLGEDSHAMLLMAATQMREHAVRDVAIVELLYSTGCRRSEVASLQLGDVDFENGVLRVVRAKSGEVHHIGIGASARAGLMQYRAEVRGYQPGPLFLARGGEALSNNGIKMVLQRLAKNAGVTATAHDFRRACAARLLERHVPLDSVMRQLGHSTATMSLIYGEMGRTKRSVEDFHSADALPSRINVGKGRR